MHNEIKAGKVDLTAENTKKVLGSADLGTDFEDADDWYDKTIVYPFGYGLSYTNFEWSNFTVTKTGTGKDVKFEASIDVKNNGPVAGKDVVEIYMNAPYTYGGIEKICLREENPVFASEYFEKLSFLSFLSHGYH